MRRRCYRLGEGGNGMTTGGIVAFVFQPGPLGLPCPQKRRIHCPGLCSGLSIASLRCFAACSAEMCHSKDAKEDCIAPSGNSQHV